VGLGLRAEFAEALLALGPEASGVRWLEVSPENVTGRGGHSAKTFRACAERWPVVTHGLSMNLGGTDPLDASYLASLAEFVREVGSPWHSEHVCFSAVGARELLDLLPIPFTRESLDNTRRRARLVRQALPVPFAVENISWYAQPGARELSEVEFLRELVLGEDLGLLLDVNNVYVNAKNHGFDAWDMLSRLPLERVVQLHVAGHRVERLGFRIDTHGEPVCDEVFALLRRTLERVGPVPVLLERDHDIPPLEVLLAEVSRLSKLYQDVCGGAP
jgi:uncharacterized protein (UPF0276 family)